MVTSTGAYAKGCLPGLLLPVCPCDEPVLARASTEDPLTLACRFGSVSCGVTVSVLCARFCLCPLRLESVAPSSVEVLQSNPTGLQGQIPWGFSVPLSNPQAGKPDVEFRTFTTMGELVWYYCYSPVCGSPIWWV